MFRRLDQEITRIKADRLERQLPYSRLRSNGCVEIGEKVLADFSSFDYLGLAHNPRVIKAAQQALSTHGISQPPSRVSAGTIPELASAEQRLAQFLGAEAAVFFSSKNQALLSLMAALVSDSEVVAFDEGCQAPLVDACLLREAVSVTFRGDKIETLDSIVDRASISPVCLYLEGLSPFSGEIFPLSFIEKKLTSNKRMHFIVDESYGLGAIGERGAGLYEASSSVYPMVSFVGAFGLGCPGYGGFVAGKGVLIEFIKQTSRAIEIEPPIPAAIAAAIEAGLDVLELEIVGRKRILEIAFRARQILTQAGLNVLGGERSPVMAVVVESFRKGKDIVARLREKGFLVDLVGARGFRRETAMIRVVFNSFHSVRQVDNLSSLLIESMQKKT